MRARPNVAFGILLFAAACSSSPEGTGGTGGTRGDDDAPGGDTDTRIPCESNDECTDDSPCTTERCFRDFCDFTPVENGLPCDDGDECTENRSCQEGVCVGSAKDCSFLGDECNTGVCDSTEGCILAPRPDGTSCSSGNACFTGDSCQDGACTPGVPTDCSTFDSDCSEGVCNTVTGACISSPINSGGSCDDGSFCTSNDTCNQAGDCIGSARDCSSLDDSCNVGICDEESDACVGQETNEGGSCDDGSACTTDDTCRIGTCAGTAIDCSGLDNACNTGVCVEPGGCQQEPINEGGPCNDSRACTLVDTCDLGACVGAGAPDCDDNDPCTADVCDEGLGGSCTNPRVPPIPNAEGAAIAGTCTDGEDNDCDGRIDAIDLSCRPCTQEAGTGVPSPDCDDGDPCTEGLCTAGGQCDPVPVTGACDDGNACTTGDACVGGVCTGTALSCSHLTNVCGTGQCSPAVGCFLSPLSEGNTCNDGLVCTINETCQAGTCQGGPRSCTAFTNDCNTGQCSEARAGCYANPLPNGLACFIDVCTIGPTCSDGVCAGGVAESCDDGDACTSDSCDPALGCSSEALFIDATSPVLASSADPTAACLVAGSNARLLVWTDLRDMVGNPIRANTGATVTIGGQAATASTSQPGIWYRELVAGAAPASSTLSVDVSVCGDSATLTGTVALETVAANDYPQGTGGCAPMDGNLRVTVVDETGTLLSGVSVLVGQSESPLFETSAEGLFGGTSNMVLNTRTTGASGTVEFYDYSGNLNGPIAVTAGHDVRVYFTVIDNPGSDVVLALRRLEVPIPPPQTTMYQGTSTSAVSGCNTVDVGIVTPTFKIEALAGFNFLDLLAPSRCWNSGAGGTLAIPGNLWVRDQSIDLILPCVGSLNEARWELPLVNGTVEHLNMAFGSVPAGALVNIVFAGGSIIDLLPSVSFARTGFMLNETVPTLPSNNRTINANSDYNSTVQVTVSGEPAETDVIALIFGDYDDLDGNGDLFLVAEDYLPFGPGNSLSIPNSDLAGANAPSGIGRMGIVTAFYIDPLDPTRTSPPPSNLMNATSTIFYREDAVGNPAVGAGAGSLNANTFIGFSATTWLSPNTFRWTDARTPGNGPLFSYHELVKSRLNFLPPLACQPNNNELIPTQQPQWYVIRPFDPSCTGGTECFTLPTLPPSFPRASSASQKRSGFEPRVGSGFACSSSSQCNQTIGEVCVSPNPSSGLQCMGGAGSANNPYFRERYRWVVHLVDIKDGASFDWRSFDFTQRLSRMTHSSTNDHEPIF